MKISQEFSKYAKSYGVYNIIQNKVIKHLISKLPKDKTHIQNILDLGCGSGSYARL